MERPSRFIRTGEFIEKAWYQIAQAGFAVILKNIAANTDIVPTPDHIHTSKTSLKATTQIIQNKLQKPEIRFTS